MRPNDAASKYVCSQYGQPKTLTVTSNKHEEMHRRPWYGPIRTSSLTNDVVLQNYVDRILRSAKAAELPIEQPTKFELLSDFKRVARATSVSGQHRNAPE